MEMNAQTPPVDGWTEWGKHVLTELIRLNSCMEQLRVEQAARVEKDRIFYAEEVERTRVELAGKVEKGHEQLAAKVEQYRQEREVKLESVHDRITALSLSFEKGMGDMRRDLGMLQTKASIWGGIAGAVAGTSLTIIGVIVASLLKSKFAIP